METLIEKDSKGNPTGKKIFWDEKCNDLKKLQCQLLMFADQGLGYTAPAQRIREKIAKLGRKRLR